MAILVHGRTLKAIDGGGRTFEGSRSVDGMVASGAATPVPLLLRSTRIHCRASGHVSAERCLSCHRLISVRPARDRSRVTIRCLWTEVDPVTDLMTPTSHMLVVPADASAADAVHAAAEHDRDLLLVVDHGVLLGVARRQVLEWAEPERSLSSLVNRRSWVASADATLADVAEMVGDQRADLVLVVHDGELLGVVTREDLLEIGWEPAA